MRFHFKAIRGSIDSSKERGVLVTSYELQVVSCDFKKINLRAASSFLQVGKKYYKLQTYFES